MNNIFTLSIILFVIFTAGELLAQTQIGGYIDRWSDYDNSDETGLGQRQFEWDTMGLRSIDSIPDVGIHPRVYFGPDDIPAMKSRLVNTESGQEVAAQIHAYTTLMHLGYNNGGTYNHNSSYGLDAQSNKRIDNAGKWNSNPEYYKLVGKDDSVWDGIEIKRRHITASAMAFEAFECMINEGGTDPDTGLDYATRSDMLATAMTFWATMALDDPNVNPNGNNYNNFGGSHMAMAYDLHFNALNAGQRDTVRMAIAKIIIDYPRHGGGLAAYAATSNWAALNSFEIITNLAIEGEVGYNEVLTERWCRAYHNFINYGFYDSGAGYEGLGKNYMFVTTAIALAKRGYSMLAHPHMKSFGTKFLPAIVQPYGHGFTSYDVWGGSGHDDVVGGYKFNASDMIGLKWIYPNDPSIDFVWRNYIERDYSIDSDDYVYQQVLPDDSYHNYLLLAGMFSEDYDNSNSWNVQASSIIKEDYIAADRGLAVMRSGLDSLDLAVQFHCRQDMGGHTHGDRNDFTLSALGRIWIRKSYGGSQFQPTWFHSGVLVDDIAMGIGDPDGDKCRQPGKLLEWYPNDNLTKVSGDATDAYTWEWHWSAQSPSADHPWLGNNGWVEVDETWNKWQFIEREEPHFNLPFYDFPHWHIEGKLERMIKREYNAMEKVFRSVGVFKGEKPFVLIVDDIKKDENSHNYKWLGQMARDLTIESTDINLVDTDYRADIIFKEPAVEGNRRLLVRVLNNEGYDGLSSPGYQDTLTYIDYFNGNTYNSNPNYIRPRLILESNSISPDFKVLLFPHNLGDDLPTTSWNTAHDTLIVSCGDIVRNIAFNVNVDGRTEFGIVGDCGLVTSTADNGPGTLRSVIDCSEDGDTIMFSIALRGKTIGVNSEVLMLNKNLNIIANPLENITIEVTDPNNSLINHLFQITSNAQVTLSGLTMVGGTGAQGSAIYNEGQLIISNCIVKRGAIGGVQSSVYTINGGALNIEGACVVE